MQGNVPASHLLNLGVDLFGQVQRLVSNGNIRALRLKLGNRVLKEIPVGPLTTIATMALVLLAIVVSTLSIEVDHEPKP